MVPLFSFGSCGEQLFSNPLWLPWRTSRFFQRFLPEVYAAGCPRKSLVLRTQRASKTGSCKSVTFSEVKGRHWDDGTTVLDAVVSVCARVQACRHGDANA